MAADRGSWVLLAVTFVACLALVALKHSWARPVLDGQVSEVVEILGTTGLGLPYLLIEGVLAIFALILPFVAGDAVARDYRRRTHELVMATPVPTASYVGGRYLAALVGCLALDLAALAAALAVGAVLPLTAGYPRPDLGLAASVWLVAAIPATLVVTSVGFALGTLLPRIATFTSLAVALGWISLVLLSDALDHGGTGFTAWNPTSYGIVRTNVDSFLRTYQAAIHSSSPALSHAQTALQLQQHWPDLAPWVPTHLILSIGSLLLVAAVAARFSRFRAVIG